MLRTLAVLSSVTLAAARQANGTAWMLGPDITGPWLQACAALCAAAAISCLLALFSHGSDAARRHIPGLGAAALLLGLNMLAASPLERDMASELFSRAFYAAAHRLPGG